MADRLAELRALRAERPERIAELLRSRTRRPITAGDGRLFIVAADHPARNALAAGGRPTAMADRGELLDRLVTALGRPGVDGVLGTPDVLEDLALLGALEGRVAVGSMNRGGLRGAVFEMDDRFTAYDVPGMVDGGIDMAKLLVRIDLADAATVRTLEATARAVTEAARARLPTLLLGGDPDTEQAELFATWADALALPGVRGMVAGRTLLYPRDDDVAGAVDAVAALVHPAEEGTP